MLKSASVSFFWEEELNYRKIFDQLTNLSRGETEWVEFKKAQKSYDTNKLGKYFSALSNEANLNNKDFGWLVLGVSDKDKSIIGTDFKNDDNKLHQLKFEIANHTTNRITFIEIHQLNIENKRILMFQIPPSPQGFPIAWKGHYYGRDGESLVPLNMNEFERIRSQQHNNDWSSYICENATIEDLEPDAIIFAREKYIEKNPHLKDVTNSWNDITFLNKAKITIEGKITNTAIILLGKPEAEIKLQPAIAEISWVLKDYENIMIDYEHFHPPFILSSTKAYKKIRNLKFRHLPDGMIFPEELFKYDDFVIREALHNCIAHQVYSLSGKITLVEKPDELIFSNVGNFFIQMPIEEVITLKTPPEIYRNKFLAKAMVEIKMIDTIGSGIQRMFQNQRKRYFPLPEYNFSDPQKVKVTIFGKILDPNYTRLLISNTNLSLQTIALLDKVQKKESITDDALKYLRKHKLIEGRKPNIFISGKVAKATDNKATYIKNRGFDKEHYQKMIIEYLKEFSSASRSEIDKLILDKLPDVLDEKQKKNKIRNLLHQMATNDIIYCNKRGKKSTWFIKSLCLK